MARKTNVLYEDGSYKKFPHRSIIGDKCKFYLWKAESKFAGAASRWVYGIEANRLLQELHQIKSKNARNAFFDSKYQILEKM